MLNGNFQDDQNSMAANSEMRRRYPRNKDKKDEWHAIVEHQLDMNNAINEYQKNLKAIKQKDYADAQMQKIAEKQQMKNMQNLQKRFELDMVNDSVNKWNEDARKAKNDRKLLFQEYLVNVDESKSLRDKRRMEEKWTDIQAENQNWAKAQQQMQQEKMQADSKKHQVHNMLERQRDDWYKKLQNDKMKKMEEGQKNLRMFEENDMKVNLKEQNYKNFYKMTDQQQRMMAEQFRKQFLDPQKEKDSKYDQMVSKNMAQEQMRRAQDEESRTRMRLEKDRFGKDVLKHQIEEQQIARYNQKVNKIQDLEKVHQQMAEYETQQQMLKKQYLDKQKQYRDILDQQATVDQQVKSKGTMTKEEKKINFGDLQAFKNQDPRAGALIPGFVNSKISPLGLPSEVGKKIPKDTTNEFIGRTTYENPNKHLNRFEGAVSGLGPYQSIKYVNHVYENAPLPTDSSAHGGIGGGLTLEKNSFDPMNGSSQARMRDRSAPKFQSYTPHPERNKIVFNNNNQFQNEASVDKTQSSPYMNAQYKGYQPSRGSGVSQSISYSGNAHNPILNPLPVNVQNPYLMKKINKISSDRNLHQQRLSNIAQSNPTMEYQNINIARGGGTSQSQPITNGNMNINSQSTGNLHPSNNLNNNFAQNNNNQAPPSRSVNE